MANVGRWRCGTCGRFSPQADRVCVACGMARDSDSGFGVLDTSSFFIPVRKRAMWMWIAVSVALPALMSGVYLLAKYLFR